MTVQLEAAPGDRTCKACGRPLPASAFYADNSHRAGYKVRCKECVLKARREQKRRKREGLAPAPAPAKARRPARRRPTRLERVRSTMRGYACQVAACEREIGRCRELLKTARTSWRRWCLLNIIARDRVELREPEARLAALGAVLERLERAGLPCP